MNIFKKKSLPLNAVSNWTFFTVNVVLSFILTPILILNLGDENYGIWALVASIIGMYGLLDLGIDSAILRYVSYYHGKEDKKSVGSVLFTSLVAYTFIGIVVLIFTFLSLDFFIGFFNITSDNIEIFKYTLIFVGCSIAITFPANVFRTSLLGYELYIINNIIRIVTEITRVGLIILALRLGYGLKGVAFITLAVSVAKFIIYFTISTLHLSDIRIQPSLFSVRILKKILLFGLPAAVTILSYILRVQIDSIVIAKWLNLSSVTLYNVAVKLTMFLTQFIVAVSGVLDPRFGSLFGKKDYQSIKKVFYEASIIITTLTFSVGFALLIFGKSIIGLWVGESYLGSYIILIILSVGQMLTCTQMPLISLLFALNKHRFIALVSIIEGVFNLILSIILVQYFGIVGVAVGTLVPIVIKIPFLFIYVIKECDFLKIDKELIIVILKPIIGITFFSLTIMLYVNMPAIRSWFLLGLAMSGMVLFFLTFTYFALISREYKNSVINIYYSIFKKT